MDSANKTSLRTIAALFLRLGFTAFGGPAAHIAMMECEVVSRLGWMSRQQFLDLVGATNLIPGPNSTELAIHIGHERGGWRGLFVAGICFIGPAVSITLVLAWLYGKYVTLPQVQPFIIGVKPAVIAIVLMAAITLARTAVKSVWLAILGVAALVLCIMGIHEIAVLFGVGFVGMAAALLPKGEAGNGSRSDLSFLLLQAGLAPSLDVSTLKIFLVFLKIGAILYGSGYVLFSFLDAELVQTGLLSRAALTDAIAAGQITPGPVFSAATFVGWQMGGLEGAAVATLGIFIPSFLFVALLNRLLPFLKRSSVFRAFLDAVNVASVAVIIAVCYRMAEEAVTDWRTTIIAVPSLVVLLFWKRLNSAFVILGGALLGYSLQFI